MFDSNLLLGAAAAAVLFGAGVLLLRRRSGSLIGGDVGLMTLALNNMTQGVVVFDSRQRLAVCNERFIDMYGLSREVVKRRAALVDVIRNRISTGSLNVDPEAYCAEILAAIRKGEAMNRIVETPAGRIVLVINKPIPDSEYWIGTHDDITERIQAERRNAALSEQERRRVVIEQELAAFKSGVAGALRTVTESNATLKAMAENLAEGAAVTSERAGHAAQSSDRSAIGITAAASAAEQMMASIGEIGHQVSRAADLVHQSVAETANTGALMSQLSETAAVIVNVVNLIRDIAEQTNLLALNATIEAARAGEAGRGFAVVAAEVKALAVQTGKATEQVAGQIGAMQIATTGAVEAIARNNTRFGEIDGYTSAIAAALTQQQSATSEISSSVSSAAEAARAVVGVLNNVARAIQGARGSTAAMLEAAATVDNAAGNLRRQIDSFLDRVAV